MSELLPSELARLLLGYIESKGYTKTAEVMINELPELAEIQQRRKKGRKVNLRVGELNLTDFLDDYSSAKDLIIEYLEKWPTTFAALKKNQSLTDRIRIILEMTLKSKTYMFYPKKPYIIPNIIQASKQMPLPLLPQNITVSIGDQVEPDCMSSKKYSTDATPESSLPGSTKRSSSPSPKEVISPEKSPKMDSSTPEKTQQKKKGSMRKKTQPSPKTISKTLTTLTSEGDDKMEKLLTNLIENKALHQKIAENINKSLYLSTDEPVDLKQSLKSDSGIHPKEKSDSGTHQELNFNASSGGSLDSVVDGDTSVGSKGSLPDNIISDLSLQVTNDPMVESILASIVCRTSPPSTLSRPLSTPVPSLSPSHSNHHSLSCSAFSSFPPCESMSDGFSQPVNQISSNFNLEQCLDNNEQTVKSSLDNIKPGTSKEVTSPSFSLPFTSAATKSFVAGPIERDFQNADTNQPETLCTPGNNDESTLRETSLGSMLTDSRAKDQVEMNSEIPLTSELDVGNMMKTTSYADPDHSTNMSPEVAKLLFSKAIETSQDASGKSENVGLVTMKELFNEAIDCSQISQKDSHISCLDTSSRKLDDSQAGVSNLDTTQEVKENENPDAASTLSNHETMPNASDIQQHKSDQLSTFIPDSTIQNFSPLPPAPVIPIPVTCSNDGFLNTKYFSGTPDHPNNYTFTELKPLPPVLERLDGCHPKLMDTVAYKTSDALSTQESLSIDSQVTPPLVPIKFSVNYTSDAPLVSSSLERVHSPPLIVSQEHLDSTILKVSRPQEIIIEALENSKHGQPIENCIATEDSNSSSLNKLETSVMKEKSEIEMNYDNSSTRTNEESENSNACSLPDLCLTNQDNNKANELNTMCEIDKEFSCGKKREQGLEVSPTSNIPLPTKSLKVNAPSSHVMVESSNAIIIDENINMENLVDELELKNIDNLSIVKKNSCANETKPSQIGVAISSESKDIKSIKSHSPGHKSLLSFSKKFTLKSNIGKNVNSPSSNLKISVYKGSLSTPRNKRNHVRALDFSTPQKGFNLRKTCSKAKASLKFSPLALKSKLHHKSKVSSSQKSLKPKKLSSLNVIAEDPKEGCHPFDDSSAENLATVKEGKGYASKIQPYVVEKTSHIVATQGDETSLVGVEEDLFLSDDETMQVIPSNVNSKENDIPKSKIHAFSLQTPGKETYSALCFETATPTPVLLKSSDALHTSELNTPILPQSSPTHDTSSILKAYPQGPYSDSPMEIYYHPSERVLNESLPYSPLQDDIESELIKMTQKTEEDMRQFQPQESPGSAKVNKVGEYSEVITSDSTEHKKISNPIFEDLLKNRPIYKMRKLNNKELGEVIEQEMELFKQMKALNDCHTNFSPEKDSLLEMKQNNMSTYDENEDSTSFVNIKYQSGITFEAFRCELEVLKTFTVAILRESHIESAQEMLKSLLSLFEKAKYHKSTFSEKDIIDLLLSVVNFYSTPEVADKLRNRTFYFAKNKEDIEIENKPSSVGIENSNSKASLTKPKANVKSKSKEIESKVKKSDKLSKSKRIEKARKGLATQKKSLEEVTLIECEIEAKVINKLEEPCKKEREKDGDTPSVNLLKESLGSTPTKKPTLDISSDGLASEKLAYNDLSPVSKPKQSKENYEKINTSENCMRAIGFIGNSLSPKKETLEDFGLVINVTPRKCKNKKDCDNNLKKMKGVSQSSENSSDSFINIQDDLSLPPTSSPNKIIDNHGEYSFIERQLAALDGSVIDSPNLRHKLENTSMDETYISAMFTPSSYPPDENVVGYSFKRDNELSVNIPTKKCQRPLISFTPLPGTPQKAVEEICQSVVKDKLALVAFPSLTQQFSNEGSDKELSEKVKDMTHKFLLNKKLSLESELTQNENLTNQSLLTSHLKENECDSDIYKIETSFEADDSDAICTLSYSDLFEFLALNLETNTENKHVKKLTRQKDTTNVKRRTSRLHSKQLLHNSSNPSTYLQECIESYEKPVEAIRQETNVIKYDTHAIPIDNCENADDNLGVLQLSSSESEESSDTSTGEMSSSDAKGSTFEHAESPKKMQQAVQSNFDPLDHFAYFNEESIYSMPPTPGKNLFLGDKLKPKSGGPEMPDKHLFYRPPLHFPDSVHTRNMGNVSTSPDLQMKQEARPTKQSVTLTPHKRINVSPRPKKLKALPEDSEISPTQRQGLRRSSRTNKGVPSVSYESGNQPTKTFSGKRKRPRSCVSPQKSRSMKENATIESPKKRRNPLSVSSNKSPGSSKKKNQPKRKSTANSQYFKQMPPNELPLLKNKISPSVFTKNTMKFKPEKKNLKMTSPSMKKSLDPASKILSNKSTSDRQLGKKIHAFTNIEKKEILDLLDFIHPPNGQEEN